MTVTEDRHGVFTTAEACIVQSDVLMDTVSTNEVFRALAARNEDFMLYVECKEEQANAA